MLRKLRSEIKRNHPVTVKRSRVAGIGLFANRDFQRQDGEEGEILTRFDFEEEAFDPEMSDAEFQELGEQLEMDRTSDEDTQRCKREWGIRFPENGRKRCTMEMKDGRRFHLKCPTFNPNKLGIFSNEARGTQRANAHLTVRCHRQNQPTAQLRVLNKMKKGEETLWDYGERFRDFLS